MCMLDEIRAKRDEIYAIARRHKAEKLVEIYKAFDFPEDFIPPPSPTEEQ